MARAVQVMLAPLRRERGFILIAVLVFAALLASLLVGVLQMSSSYVLSAAAYSDASRADELGRTATQLVAQQTLSLDPNAKRGGSFAVHLKDADIFVDYLAETARIDVNGAPAELLVKLFKAAGVEPGEAEAIGARIKAWRKQPTSPNNQNALSPGNASAQAAPKESRARIMDESQIADAWDISQDELAMVRSYLTVSNRLGKVDPILADRLVVEAIFDGDELRAGDFLRRRAQGFATEAEALSAVPAEAQGYVGFSPAKAFRAIVRVRLLNRVERRYEMVVVPPQERGAAVRVTAWKAL